MGSIDYWSLDEIRTLQEHFPKTTNEKLCKILNKSELSITSKAQRMKLKKNWQFRQQILREAKIR